MGRGRNSTDSGGAPEGDGYGQPTYGQGPYGQNQQGPYGRTQQEQGSWTPPYGAPPAAAPAAYVAPVPTGRGNGRPGLIVLFSLLTQLIVVGAIGNTWVVRHAFDYYTDHNDTLGRFSLVPSIFSWRFTPLAVDTDNKLYLGSLAGLGALLVVAALLTLALVRGPVTFWRAFVGVWLSVIAGTLVNGMVRRAIFEDVGQYRARGGRLAGVFFDANGAEVVAGVLLGLIAGLVAALVAVVSRRKAVAPVPVVAPEPEAHREPDAPPPWYGGDPTPTGGTSPSMQKVQSSVEGPVPGSTSRLPDVAPPPRSDTDAQATTQFKAVPAEAPPAQRVDEPTQASLDATPAVDEANQTTVFRRPQAPTRPDEPVERPEPATRPDEQRGPTQQPDAQSTQAFPRPPDDEDEGHHPDH